MLKTSERGGDERTRIQDVHDKMIVEQYKHAHLNSIECSKIQWQIVGLGGPLVGTLLVAAFTNTSEMVSTILCGFALPLCLLLLIAYRKLAYFENLADETIDAMEAQYGLKHVQTDTVPQKPQEKYYVARRPKRWAVEGLSLYTVITALLATYNIVALVAFIYYLGSLTSVWFATISAIFFYLVILTSSSLANRVYRSSSWSEQ